MTLGRPTRSRFSARRWSADVGADPRRTPVNRARINPKRERIMSRMLLLSGMFALALALAPVPWASDSVVAWGAGGCGQSGAPHYGQSCVPSKNNKDFIAVAGGRDHSLALKSNGSITAWGSNALG